MKLVFRPHFLESVADQAEYLGERAGHDVAERFIEAIKDATEQLSLFPHLGFTHDFINSNLQSLRVWRVRGFEKCLIFYIPREDSVEFIYLVHSARDFTRLFGSGF